MIVAIAAWTILWIDGSGSANAGVIAGAVLVCAISFLDDIRSVSRWLRLLVQLAAVVAGLAAFPSGDAILGDQLPLWLDRALVGIGWLWFINLFNFMDGIDGLAASEAAIVSLGLLVLGRFWPDLALAPGESVVILSAALAFLVLNWHPARLFMGDVGSAGLGFLLGWLLIDAAASGQLAAAIILPLFFAADATSTLALRAWRRSPLATAHRDHAYQAAVDRGVRQDEVVLQTVAVGVALIGLAALSPNAPWPSAIGAVMLTGILIIWMRRGGGRYR
jgi:UDP-N-acetylmuramyl pentapeptide phosphotransferase/UDP-N-acetylglucosamine-1-phosphate transferase